MEQQKRKTIQDVKKEYGFILRWTNGGGCDDGSTYPYHFYLENVRTSGTITIDDECALAFIKTRSTCGFRDKYTLDCYKNHVTLFNLLGIRPICSTVV